MIDGSNRLRAAIRSLRLLRGQFAGNGVVNRALISIYENARTTIEEETGNDLSHLSADRLGSAGIRSVFIISGLYPAIDQILLTVDDDGDRVAGAQANNAGVDLQDSDLAGRCESLLTDDGPFDRAINQATQVLEVRLRSLSNYTGTETGHSLVSRVLNGDPALALLRVSDVPAEQEGFANLCRGIMQYLRNPTHHSFKEVTRDDANRVCLFVDYLLAQLAAAKRRV